MRATAIIPVKRFGTAKQRLLEALAGKAARLREKRVNVVPATAPESQTE